MSRGYQGIWVFAGQKNNKINKSTFELLGKAKELANKINTEVCAVFIGHEIANLAEELIHYGANKVYLVEHEKLKNYTTIPYTKVFAKLVKQERPDIVLYAADTTGRDLAPRVAARLRTGLTADCTDLDIGEYVDKWSKRRYDNLLYQIRPALGGDVMATIVTPDHRPQMATARPGTFEPVPKDAQRKGKIIPFKIKLDEHDTLVDVIEVKRNEDVVNLADARIIISGGRGVGGLRGFNLLKEWASTIGAHVAATRPAVDAGWISYSHQVGQTGQMVKPDIYIACGISGAIQHIVGIKNSKKIIAINKDQKSPIFDVADYCIVGDLFEVLPKLVQKLKDT